MDGFVESNGKVYETKEKSERGKRPTEDWGERGSLLAPAAFFLRPTPPTIPPFTSSPQGRR